MTTAEIAAVLGIGEAAVKIRQRGPWSGSAACSRASAGEDRP